MDNCSYDSIVTSSLTREEIIQCLEQHGIVVDPTQRRVKLEQSLVKTLKMKHPLHLFIQNLPSKDLKAIWNHFCLKGHFQERERTKVINFLFKAYPSKPLETVKSFLENEKFKGLPLQNPKNQCYVNSAVNLLLCSEILSTEIEKKEKETQNIIQVTKGIQVTQKNIKETKNIQVTKGIQVTQKNIKETKNIQVTKNMKENKNILEPKSLLEPKNVFEPTTLLEPKSTNESITERLFNQIHSLQSYRFELQRSNAENESYEFQLIQSSNDAEKMMIERLYHLILELEIQRNENAGETNIEMKDSIIGLINKLKLHRNNVNNGDETDNGIFQAIFELFEEVLKPSNKIVERNVE